MVFGHFLELSLLDQPNIAWIGLKMHIPRCWEGREKELEQVLRILNRLVTGTEVEHAGLTALQFSTSVEVRPCIVRWLVRWSMIGFSGEPS